MADHRWHSRFTLFGAFIVAAFDALIRPSEAVENVNAMQRAADDRRKREVVERRTAGMAQVRHRGEMILPQGAVEFLRKEGTRAMAAIVNCNAKQETEIGQACAQLLAGSAHRMNATGVRFRLHDMTAEGESIGNWTVIVRRSKAP